MSSTSKDERVRQVPLLGRLLSRPELGAIAGTVLVFAFFAAVAGTSGLFSAKGIVNFLEVSAQLGILAAPVALLMIAGEFDLSLGSMIGFAGILIAIPAVFWHWPVWTCIIFAFAVSGIIGAANGYMVVRTGLPSFIVTLGGLFMLRGLTLGITRGISGRTQVSGLHELAANDPLNSLFSGQVFAGPIEWLASVGVIGLRPDGKPSISGIPVSILWWVGLTLFCAWLLSRTRFGNWIFASGGEPNAARNVGVPVNRTKITLFVMTAWSATLFAAIQVLVTGSADTLRGTQKEFEAIIAVVIGGTLLTGGYGSAVGALFGALIFGVVQMGIFYTGVDTDWFKFFMGAMMLIAVLFNSYVRNRAMRSR
ncbi:ABC transporter permease [Aestuariivirga litoralis]|uniref:ABC transporter permease n=1 Tax=Aestuariivirga litoralis TaxID=2650924 RepID=UPI0018C476D4|nr:ABC transporter permease [Aestuariivirga litoralis]MBG1232388.1 ABC transporter permease [Aestuariivirga litoralis]